MTQPDKVVYVQHVLEDNKALLIEHIYKRNGSVYLCGNIGMSRAVEAVIKSAIREHLSVDEKQADTEFFRLKDQKRLCIEAWG